MAHKIIDGRRTQTRGRMRELFGNNSVEHPDGTNAKRERLLAVLKTRYGYSNDKAVDELARLLKQFYGMNRKTTIRHTRPHFELPHTE
jgi:uncharacterized protein YjbJ (UPF0337 family)